MRISFQPPLVHCIYMCVYAYFFGSLVFTFDRFLFFCLIEFIMDLHPYDIEHHDTTRHDNCHARIHGLMHDNRLRACQSCL